jgi:putative transposase
MARIPRSALPDGFFHVHTRGVFGLDVFPDADHRTEFMNDIARCTGALGWICHAAVVLTTHYHVVLETTRERLSRGLHGLNGHYALRFNERHERYGHVFAERFRAKVIEDEDYLFDACNYVVLNPVKAGLCERPEDWPWSFSRYGL